MALRWRARLPGAVERRSASPPPLLVSPGWQVLLNLAFGRSDRGENIDSTRDGERGGTIARGRRLGRVDIYGWYDVYPASMTLISGMTIHQGDTLTATISTAQIPYTFTLSNLNTGASFKIAKAAGGKLSDAQTLVECYTTCPTFGQVAFSAATINGQPLAQADPDILDGLPGTTSAITDGEDFTVTQATT
jgi:hypothetical protein